MKILVTINLIRSDQMLIKKDFSNLNSSFYSKHLHFQQLHDISSSVRRQRERGGKQRQRAEIYHGTANLKNLVQLCSPPRKISLTTIGFP